jgi:asparagine synthase (glutamine-hydrolysing)
MCGISGVLSFDGSPVDEATLSAQTRALAHRGPDGEGCWVSPSRAVGLGHRRLAIIDLSEAARQPMGLRGRFTITYNGEIYNYVEVRAELQGLGWTFATQSDTEVLLAAYAQFGEAALERLDGMFAFAIWDEREQTLFCARDRFGEKPFYYVHEVGRRFVFASEIKGLVAAGVAPRLDRRSLYQYLAFEVVQDPARADETFYEGVRSLEPAHCLTVSFRHGLARPRRYWSIPARQPAAAPGLAEAAERFLHLLDTSVKRRLRSDVPVGSSLSGGLDSSSVVCLMHRARAGQQALAQNSFSARFREPRLDEGPYIEAVVEATGTTPHVVWPDGEGLAAGMTALVRHQEEPFAGASVYAQWEVMRLAQREGTKVLLDGQGADETLAGYLHFFEPYLRASRGAAPVASAKSGPPTSGSTPGRCPLPGGCAWARLSPASLAPWAPPGDAWGADALPGWRRISRGSSTGTTRPSAPSTTSTPRSASSPRTTGSGRSCVTPTATPWPSAARCAFLSWPTSSWSSPSRCPTS